MISESSAAFLRLSRVPQKPRTNTRGTVPEGSAVSAVSAAPLAGPVTMRCRCGRHHACPTCACPCHDPQPELPLEDVALHEAGHVVAALLLGIPVDRVTIRRDGHRLGQVRLDTPALDHQHARAHALVALAGLAATGMTDDHLDGAVNDLREARRALAYLAPPDPDVALLELYRDAAVLLSPEAATVRRVAGALLERSDLTGAELREVLT